MSQAGAYAAVGGGVAVIGFGTMVTAYKAATGQLLWHASITGVPTGSVMVGVRVFPGVVAVGMIPPAGPSPGRDEVILSAATGREIRTYPAATYGGAIEADTGKTVVVGARSVTAYANATGHVLWSRTTGPAGQTWRVSGPDLYVTVMGNGRDQAVVTGLRRIDLRTGAERLVRPPRSAFTGTFSDAVDGVVLFSGTDGVRAYSGATGRPLWRRAAAVLELADSGRDTVYLASGSKLIGVSVVSGTVVSSAAAAVAGSLYSVSDGVALALDQGGLGQAWGYDLSTRQVVWTSGPLPWPHFFVDLSGLGGSASPGSDIVVLTTCAEVGAAGPSAAGPVCLRPELAAVLV